MPTTTCLIGSTMKRTLAFALLALGLVVVPACAQDAVKVGIVAPFTGPFAAYGKMFEAGAKAWQKLHGDTVAGRKIELIIKDTGAAPDAAKRHAQELVVQEHVDFLAGFGLTPEALAVADVATQARTPMVIFNAATSIITTKSPYVTRTSMTLPQVSAPLGTWAARNGIKKVVTLVADYGPGKDAESAFQKTFTAGGGQVIESIRTPLQNPEFTPFIQRVRDAKPDAVFIFVPAGEQSIAVMKAYTERGLAQAGIKAIATGDVTDDFVLDAMGDAALGLITTFHYSAAHDSPENKAFLAQLVKGGAKLDEVTMTSVAAYDGARLIYKMIEATNGQRDPEKALAAVKGMKWVSPRGPVSIDPDTRHIRQNVYLREVAKQDGKLINKELQTFDAQPDWALSKN